MIPQRRLSSVPIDYFFHPPKLASGTTENYGKLFQSTPRCGVQNIWVTRFRPPWNTFYYGPLVFKSSYQNRIELVTRPDFEQMVANCLSYNERDTIFFRAGVKMRDQGGQIIRQARRMIEEIGFDPKTGLHLQDEDVKNVKKEEVLGHLNYLSKYFRTGFFERTGTSFTKIT